MLKKHYKRNIAIAMCSILIGLLAGCGDAVSMNEDTQIEETSYTETAEYDESSSEIQPDSSAQGISVAADHKITVGYMLEQTGTFEDMDNLGSMGNAMVIVRDEDTVAMIANDGSVLADAAGCSYLGNGYYILQDLSGDINSVSLYSADGTQLIPFEAADISWLESEYYDVTEEQRYLKVIYATGETDNEDEAFFYVTENLISLYAGDDDVLYTGYAKIYDTESRQFVSGVEVTNSYMYAAQACGNSFVVEDEEGVARLYDSDGNILLEKEGLEDVGYGYVIFRDTDAFEVYDETGAWRLNSADTLVAFDSTSGYIEKFTDDGIELIDIEGNLLLADIYESYSYERYGFFDVMDDLGNMLLLDQDGNSIVSADSIVEILHGYFYFPDETGYYSVVNGDGILAEGADSPEELAFIDGTLAMLINDGTYSLELEGDYWQSLVPGMIASKSDETGKYGVFDLFTGTQLLEYDYAAIYAHGDYLYARQDDVWIIFEIIPVYGE